MMPEHRHDWSPWVWDSWVFQLCWRRNCRVQDCFANLATEDITVVDPSIVIDHEREWIFPDGDVEYTELGLNLLRTLSRKGRMITAE